MRIALITSFVLLLLVSCATTPITGRKQVLLLPETREIEMGLTAYEDALVSESPSQNQEFIEVVNRVGQRIAAVANRPDYQWEFRVISSPQQNAFALPGGKVAIYEGILPVCQNEAGLAVVMSHEIAHALARHGGERMSHTMLVNGVGSAVGKVLQNQESVHSEQIMKAYGVGSEYLFVLPYSRKHESEADHMGMMLMAQAGYDPSEAPRFWQRFATAKTNGSVAEFLSTHPSDERRARDLQELLPQAMGLYLESPQRWGLGEMLNVQHLVAASAEFPKLQAEGANSEPAQAPGDDAAARMQVPALVPRDPTRM